MSALDSGVLLNCECNKKITERTLQVVEFSCLGDWVVGKNQYFAVANTKESRIDEKFRCFMKNRDDDYFLGQSNTPECNHIKTVEQVFESHPIKPKSLVGPALCP